MSKLGLESEFKDNEDMREVYEALNIESRSNTKDRTHQRTFTLNEPVGSNGFRFWREISPHIAKDGSRVRRALFICPHCKDLNEMAIQSVLRDSIKSCGCLGRKS